MLRSRLSQLCRSASARQYTTDQGRSASGKSSTDGKSGSQYESTKEATYKSPEYYQHDTFSYVDYDVKMEKYRLPQPSSKPKK